MIKGKSVTVSRIVNHKLTQQATTLVSLVKLDKTVQYFASRGWSVTVGGECVSM